MPTQHPPHSLQHLNTFGLDCRAAGFLRLESLDQLSALEAWRDVPHLVLGGGSNMLFFEDFSGLVIQNALKGIEITESEDGWHLHVAAGENWHQLICHTLSLGIGGLENMALIPGTVGAAPIQNIGAYGVELKDVCRYVDLYDLSTGERRRLDADQCRFGYRDSIFKRELKDRALITAVGLFLPRDWQPNLDYRPLAGELGDEISARAIFEAVCRLRQSKLPDPAKLGNAGSFFKNPVIPSQDWQRLRLAHPQLPGWDAGDDQIKVPAGWLIDRAGLKGHCHGRAGVHQDQALVLVNHGGALASELLELAALVQDRVQQRYGILLEPEVRFIGARGEAHWQQALTRKP